MDVKSARYLILVLNSIRRARKGWETGRRLNAIGNYLYLNMDMVGSF